MRSTIHSWYNMKYWRNWWHKALNFFSLARLFFPLFIQLSKLKLSNEFFLPKFWCLRYAKLKKLRKIKLKWFDLVTGGIINRIYWTKQSSLVHGCLPPKLQVFAALLPWLVSPTSKIFNSLLYLSVHWRQFAKGQSFVITPALNANLQEAPFAL